jgi:hypothetical protein
MSTIIGISHSGMTRPVGVVIVYGDGVGVGVGVGAGAGVGVGFQSNASE